jgi:hypothetical protein
MVENYFNLSFQFWKIIAFFSCEEAEYKDIDAPIIYGSDYDHSETTLGSDHEGL